MVHEAHVMLDIQLEYVNVKQFGEVVRGEKSSPQRYFSNKLEYFGITFEKLSYLSQRKHANIMFLLGRELLPGHECLSYLKCPLRPQACCEKSKHYKH